MTRSKKDTVRDLRAENERLRLRLLEAEDILEAIRSGEVDALVVSGPHGEQVYTLTGANLGYRILFEKMNEGAAILGADGTIFYCNARLASLLQKPMEEIVGGSILRFVPEEYSASFEALLHRGLETPQKGEFELRSHGGNIVACHVSTSPFSVEEAPNICMIVTDLTERKRAENTLKHTLADLTRSNADLEKFAYVASHDLQEPLRNIANCLQMLRKKYKDKIDADADRYIDYAVEGAGRLQVLIKDLLHYSRVATRVNPPQLVDCEKVLDRTVRGLTAAVTDVGAVITHDPLPTIPADETQLFQVFQNLIENAVRFRREEPLRVHVSAVKNEKEWIFSVKDNGIGIESQHFDRIFAIFQRLHSRRKYDGTGMGLAIVKKVVDRHGGRVWVESELGQGSTFHFSMPEKRMRT
ncbi:MAG: ATP-binding protein [Desulfomonilaceae bacterium]|nr:ATP-binding protein [Desulfomonilaceae bacterium]